MKMILNLLFLIGIVVYGFSDSGTAGSISQKTSEINQNGEEKKSEKIFLIIFGPHAVGKMTVGQDLSKITDLKLFHNHMIMEPLLSMFDFYDPHFRKLVQSIRCLVFEEIANSDLRGVVFTFNWNFNSQNSKESVDLWSQIFKKEGGKVYVVELVADLDVRLKRNRTENRLLYKPCFRDIEKSEKILLDCEKSWKMQSHNNFYYGDKFLRIYNNDKTSLEVAKEIKDFFGL
ncbi:MAG: hypothetical protein KR126chlam5_01243 [Candidatus Anoxychlamydiales bacterium]|nr:hypothetical protein [Candidatus Anoxychlamydiales bacterium]